MAKNTTFEKLKQRIKELEKELTERKHLEETLHENASMLENILEKAADGICVCHSIPEEPFVRFTHWNPRMTAITGYIMEEINQLGWYQTMYPDLEIQKRAIERMARMRAGDDILAEEWVITTKDGEKKPLSISTSIVKEEDGKVHVLAVMQDISGRKQVEESLHKSERESKQLAQENAIMVEIGRIVSSTLEIDEVYELFAKEVNKLIPFDRIVISMVNLEKGTGVSTYMAGKGIPDRKADIPYLLEGTGIAEMIRTKSTLLFQTEDIDEVKDRFPQLLSTFEAGFRSIMNVPLFAKGQIIGGLLFRSCQSNAYKVREVQLAERVGNQIAGAVANAQLYIERKKKEDELRESEKKYRQLIETLQEGIWVIDRDACTTFVNLPMSKMLGYSIEEMQGKHLFSFMSEQGVEFGRRYLERRQQGIKEQHEFEFLRKDGSRVYALLETSPILNENGNYAGALAGVVDITERKRVEEELRKSEEKYRFITDRISDVIWILDTNLQPTYVSPSVLKVLGFTPEEHLRQHLQERVTPASVEKVQEILKYELQRDRERGVDPERTLIFELEYYHKNGSIIWMEQVIGFIRDSEGNVVGIHGVSRNINKRKQAEEALRESEEKYRSILENIAEGYYEVDLAGNLTFFNDSVCRMMGYPREELMGMNNRQYMDQMNAKKVYQTFNKVYQTGKPTEEFGWEIIRKDGAKRFIGASVSLIRDSKGQPAGFRGIVRDLTERKAAQEVIRRERDFSEFAINAMPGIFYIFDENGKFLRWNRNLEVVTGYTAAEIARRTPLDHLREDCRELVKERIREAYSTGQSEVEAVLVSKSGKETPYWFYGHRVVLNGEPCLIGMGVDISDRKRAEKALCESEERFRNIAEATSEFIWETDVQARYTYVTERIEVIFRRPLTDIVGHKPFDFMPPEEARRVRKLISEAARQKQPFRDLEHKTLRPDGTVFWQQVSGIPLFNKDGDVTGYRGTAADITERKRAEEALRRSEEGARRLAHENAVIAEIGRIISSTLNIEEVYERFTEEVSKLISFDRTTISIINPGEKTFTVAYVVGVDVIDSRPGDVLPIKGSAVEEVMRTRSSLLIQTEDMEELQTRFPGVLTSIQAGLRSMISVPLISKDQVIGALHFRSLKVNAYTESDLQLAQRVGNQIAGAIANAQLFAEHERSEMEKTNLQQQLQQSQKMEAVGRLAGGIAHDFNNLLTVIKGYCDLALMGLREEGPLKRAIEEISKAGDRAAILTHQLLAFSRRQILELKIVNLNDILRNLNKMLRRLIGEDIELVTILGEDLGKVKVDPGQMEQVVMNLAVNARDVMPMGGKLILETFNVDLDEEDAASHVDLKAGPHVMLSVRDTGVGIPSEVMEHIFEPFFTTKEKGKGTGLGLSMVYGMVNQSGGSIGVESEPGRGTTFKIYFPRVAERVEGVEARPIKQEIPRGSETILVVEDDGAVRNLASQILKRQGYRVLEASGGEEALGLYGRMEESIQLVLTDVVMPRMSGRELVEHLISLYPGMKALYMSGYTDDAIVHHGVLEEGVNYIQKPFTMEGLAKKVREVLDKS